MRGICLIATLMVVRYIDVMYCLVPFVPLLSVGFVVGFFSIASCRSSFLFLFLCLLLLFWLLLFLKCELSRLYH